MLKQLFIRFLLNGVYDRAVKRRNNGKRPLCFDVWKLKLAERLLRE